MEENKEEKGRLGELKKIRDGIIEGMKEWKNRKNRGIVDKEAKEMDDERILHFKRELGAVDKDIALTIDNFDLRSKRDIMLSMNGVGDTLAGVVLEELMVWMY